jgi:hypothetical protein
LTIGKEAITVLGSFRHTPLGESVTLTIPENSLDSEQAKSLLNRRHAGGTAPLQNCKPLAQDWLCVSSAATILSGKTFQEVSAACPENLATTPRRAFTRDFPSLMEKLTSQKWYLYRALAILSPFFEKIELPNYPLAVLVSQEFSEDPMGVYVVNGHWIAVRDQWVYDPYYRRPIELEDYRRAGWRAHAVLLPGPVQHQDATEECPVSSTDEQLCTLR